MLEDSIYVHHDFHRQKVGSRLLQALIEMARHSGPRSLLANISADQTPSIRLHEKFGFQKVAHLREVGHKFNQRFDAIYLQLHLAANLSPEPSATGATRSANLIAEVVAGWTPEFGEMKQVMSNHRSGVAQLWGR